jgi:Domain of unknown function (DUF397)
LLGAFVIAEMGDLPGNCVEVAVASRAVAVRDSKDPMGPRWRSGCGPGTGSPRR